MFIKLAPRGKTLCSGLTERFDIALHQFVVHGDCRADSAGGSHYDLMNTRDAIAGRETARHTREVEIVCRDPFVLTNGAAEPLRDIGSLVQRNAQKQSFAKDAAAAH
jgi:hypothetical protein